MGMLDKRIQTAVFQALKPVEKTLIDMAEKTAEQNRGLMLKQVERMRKELESLVEEKVKEALRKDV